MARKTTRTKKWKMKRAAMQTTVKRLMMVKFIRKKRMKTLNWMTKFKTTTINSSTKNLCKKSAHTRKRANKIKKNTVRSIKKTNRFKRSTTKKSKTRRHKKNLKTQKTGKKKADTKRGTIKMS